MSTDRRENSLYKHKYRELVKAIEDAITEIQTEYNKHSDEWNYQAGLWFAMDVIRKQIKDGERR